jgi:outer membrane protein assembly factor BamB
MITNVRCFVLVGVATVLVAGCSLFDKAEDLPLPGTRVNALPMKIADMDTGAISAFVLPDVWRNDMWPQAGGFPGHSMQNLALAPAVTKHWSMDIGQGATKEAPLTAQPVVAGGRVYTLDSHGQLSALRAASGKQDWRLYVGSRDEDDFASGGGVAIDQDALYVTNGYAEVLALKADKGQEYWRTRLSAPARSAPSVLDDRVFVMTIDGQIHALNAIDGKILWSYRGLASGAGVLGTASPAVNRDLVIAPFSSGEIVALRVENGSVAWSDNLAPPVRFGGLFSLGDIRALPIMDNGLVFAMSYGGRLVALDERTGARVWQRDIGGADTPWIAGDNIFVLTKDAQLFALDRTSGGMRWRLDLPRYDDPVSKDNPVLWSGPVLAGGRLMVVRTDGQVYDINPETGNVLGDWDVGATLATPLVVADETLYALGRNGILGAWK